MFIWFTSAIFALLQQIANYLASSLENGSVSAINYSLLFFQLPYGLFYASIAKVILPDMSEKIGFNNLKEAKKTLLFGCEGLMLLLIPSSVMLILASNEIIAVALQRGAFTLKNTITSSSVLRYYSMGMVFIALYNIMQRFFFVNKDRKIVIILAITIAFIDIALSLLLIPILRVKGIAFANSITYFIILIILMLLFHFKYGSFYNNRTLLLVIKILLATLCLVISHFFLNKFILPKNWWYSGAKLINLFYFICDGLVMLITVLIVYSLLGISVRKIITKKNSQ